MEKLNLNNAIQLSFVNDDFKSFDFEKEFKNLKIGDVVKVCCKTRFYHIAVTEVVNFQFLIGKIIDIDFLDFNSVSEYIDDKNDIDRIEFSFENIYDIIKVNEFTSNDELVTYVISELMLKGKLMCNCGKCNDAFFITAYNKYYEYKKKKEEKN